MSWPGLILTLQPGGDTALVSSLISKPPGVSSTTEHRRDEATRHLWHLALASTI